MVVALVVVPLPFTPVPLSLQAFSVLLAGASRAAGAAWPRWRSTCWPAYAFGVAGLMAATGLALPVALAESMLPFLIGDAVTIALAAALLPAVCKAVGARRG